MSTSATPVQQGRFVVIVAGFFGWMLAGVQLAVTSIVMRDAAKDLLGAEAGEGDVQRWFAWLLGAFLLGAALGGYGFGAIGDRIGRKTAIALSIATYSMFAGLTYFVESPMQLLMMRFLVGAGVGGMWPNGIALVSEAWPNMSRPMLAGVIGTAANVGIMCFSILTMFVYVTQDDWRWVMLLTFTPILLALFVYVKVPESARWLESVRNTMSDPGVTRRPEREIFSYPMIGITLIGITLGTIPLFGGWGSTNWASAWASKVGADMEKQADASQDVVARDQKERGPALKALAQLARSAPGSLASLLGGAIATIVGRRRFYCFLCIACLVSSQYLFLFSDPSQPQFLWAMGILGLFSGFFFGWLPLCLPELFPTRIRATGAGVSFNFGRIATAIGLGLTGLLISYFQEDYARIGQITSWIYLVGAIAIWFAPPMGTAGLQD